jgi:hypothetical protein
VPYFCAHPQVKWSFELDLASRHGADAAEAVTVMRTARMMAMATRWKANARERRRERGESSGSEGYVMGMGYFMGKGYVMGKCT